MNKRDLIRELAKRTGLRLAQAQMVLDVLFGVQDEPGIIPVTLRRGEKVVIPGFGSFTVRTRKARRARNPRTGETIQVPERRVPAFKAGRHLTQFIAEK